MIVHAGSLDTRIYLKSVTVVDNVKSMDLLCAFPACSPLDSLDVIRETTTLNDTFLQTLATHAMWRNKRNVKGSFTDEGILDYVFGDYGSNERQRVLNVSSEEISPKLLQKLVNVGDSRWR